MKDEYDFTKGKRGPVVKPSPNKQKITIRLDREIIEWFKREVNRQGGGSYQRLINDALLAHIQGQRLEDVIRDTVREELGKWER